MTMVDPAPASAAAPARGCVRATARPTPPRRLPWSDRPARDLGKSRMFLSVTEPNPAMPAPCIAAPPGDTPHDSADAIYHLADEVRSGPGRRVRPSRRSLHPRAGGRREAAGGQVADRDDRASIQPNSQRLIEPCFPMPCICAPNRTAPRSQHGGSLPAGSAAPSARPTARRSISARRDDRPTGAERQSSLAGSRPAQPRRPQPSDAAAISGRWPRAIPAT